MLDIPACVRIIVVIVGRLADAVFLGHFDVIVMFAVNGRCEAAQ